MIEKNEKSEIMDLPKILDSVPDYQEFLTPNELLTFSKQLAQKFPKSVQFQIIGKSQENKKIGLLTIGTGEHKAFLYGFPHPNEPIGSLTIKFWAEYLARNHQLVDQLNFSWLLIPCIDPDGAEKNQGWFKGSFQPIKYFIHRYRQRNEDQIDWSFPVEYKKLKRKNPLPETQVIMDIIQDHQPILMASLHNAPFFGVHAYVNKNIPTIFNEISQFVRQEGLPIHSAAPIWIFQEVYAPGFYYMGGIRDIYDYYEQYQPEALENLELAAFSGEYYNIQRPEGFFINIEVPLYFSWELTNKTKTAIPLLETEKRIYQHILDNIKFLQSYWSDISQRINKQSSLYPPIQDYMENWEKNIQTELKGLTKDPELKKAATKADIFYANWVQKYNRCLQLGGMIRLINEATINPEDPLLLEIKEQILQKIIEIDQEVRKKIDIHFPSIRKNVRVQLNAILTSVKYFLLNNKQF